MQIPIHQGSIVVYKFVPRRGEPKRRFCVVYTPDSLIEQSVSLDLVMISTSIRPNDPDCIPLPFHPEGNVCTKLRKPSAIVLTETDTVPKNEITPTWAHIPVNTIMIEMLAGLKRLGKLR